MKSFRFRLLASLAFAIGLAQGGPLLPCTGATLAAQEEQSNCVVANPGVSVVVTASFTNDPTFMDTPSSQRVDQYQTTLTAVLNGGTTVFQEILAVPFSDPSVQNAILQADAVLSLDGATFGGPSLNSSSTSLQSSVLTDTPTTPVFDLATLIACGVTFPTTLSCSGVAVTIVPLTTVTYGPATIAIGPDYSDEFYVAAGQEDININEDYTYTVDQNATTHNTYLTAQSYEIDGTTESSSVPYGAVAISASTLNMGGSHGQGSQSDAEQKALQTCQRSGSKDCVVYWARNQCVALATTAGVPSTYGAAVAPDRSRAAAAALAQCTSRGGKECAVRVTPCAGDDVRWSSPLPLPPGNQPESVDPSLVGMWVLSINPGYWVWEIGRNGTYTFHSEAADDAPSHMGMFTARNGHYTLHATNMPWDDAGTYKYQAPGTLVITGRLGTGTFHRIASDPHW